MRCMSSWIGIKCIPSCAKGPAFFGSIPAKSPPPARPAKVQSPGIGKWSVLNCEDIPATSVCIRKICETGWKWHSASFSLLWEISQIGFSRFHLVSRATFLISSQFHPNTVIIAIASPSRRAPVAPWPGMWLRKELFRLKLFGHGLGWKVTDQTWLVGDGVSFNFFFLLWPCSHWCPSHEDFSAAPIRIRVPWISRLAQTLTLTFGIL